MYLLLACSTVLYVLACDSGPCLGNRAQAAGRAWQAWKSAVEKLRVWRELEVRSAGWRALHVDAARDILERVGGCGTTDGISRVGRLGEFADGRVRKV